MKYDRETVKKLAKDVSDIKVSASLCTSFGDKVVPADKILVKTLEQLKKELEAAEAAYIDAARAARVAAYDAASAACGAAYAKADSANAYAYAKAASLAYQKKLKEIEDEG
jgi:predicted metalloendopeptidase